MEDVGLRAADTDLVGAPHGPQGRRGAEQPVPWSAPAALDHETTGAGGRVAPRIDAHDHELGAQARRNEPADRGEHPSLDRTRAVTAGVEERQQDDATLATEGEDPAGLVPEARLGRSP